MFTLFLMFYKMRLQVVAFQVPAPPTYGGVMDVYYRLKALKQAGVDVTLHTFYYADRTPLTDLSDIASKVYYYKRSTGLASQISKHPYIVKSRQNDELLHNLLKESAPILFEGLHTCYYLSHPSLSDRVKFVRMHNIESDYYRELANVSINLRDRLFFRLESIKLKVFESKIAEASAIFATSDSDTRYLKKKYPDVKIFTSPCCHPDDKRDYSPTNSGEPYCIYHGNFTVAENIKAATYLIKNVAGRLDMPLYIAGKNAKSLNKKSNPATVRIVSDPKPAELQTLISNAKANLLITFQPTGLKLKLLNALNWGGFCVVNDKMLAGTHLAPTCIVANTSAGIIQTVNTLKEKIWSSDDEVLRQETIKLYDNDRSIEPILNMLKSYEKH